MPVRANTRKPDGKQVPALKPTRFMTSSLQMASVLNKRCPRNRKHQQLVGGRAAQAAFYPLGLIQAILQGIRNTALAEGAAVDPREDERHAIQAVIDSNGKNTPWASGIIAPDSSVKLVKGGVLPILAIAFPLVFSLFTTKSSGLLHWGFCKTTSLI